MIPIELFDLDYEPEEKDGDPMFPKNVEKESINGRVYYRLPNGKYLPDGVYFFDDGSSMIYEPYELSDEAILLAGCTITGEEPEDDL